MSGARPRPAARRLRRIGLLMLAALLVAAAAHGAI